MGGCIRPIATDDASVIRTGVDHEIAQVASIRGSKIKRQSASACQETEGPERCNDRSAESTAVPISGDASMEKYARREARDNRFHPAE